MLKDCLESRSDLISNVYDELVGPGSGEAYINGEPASIPDKEHEIITDKPEQRYYVGVLFPIGCQMKVDNDASREETGDSIDVEEAPENWERKGDLAAGTDITDESIDEVIALSTQDRPSSIGLTFIVDKDIETVCADISFGVYHETTPAECMVPYNGPMTQEAILHTPFSQYVYRDGDMLYLKYVITRRDIAINWQMGEYDDRAFLNALYKLASQCKKGLGFKREPKGKQIEIPLDGSTIGNICDVSFANVRAVKSEIGNGKWSITVMLYNSARGYFDGTNSILQPNIAIDSRNNTHFKICAYEDNMRFSSDPEERSLALLYRNKVRYASGHGVATKWTLERDYVKLETDLMPQKQVPQMDFQDAFNHGVDKKSLSLKYLSDLSNVSSEERLLAIEQLVSAYESWIEHLKQRTVPSNLKVVAEQHIALCSEAADRMRRGIDCLRKDPLAMQAYELANRAMFYQMIHRKKVASVSEDEDSTTVDYVKEDYANRDNDYCEFIWRPFQAAFLLLSIRGLVDCDVDTESDISSERERDLVDIIWFPTGGGKTEAYLAVTAFTIFYRRLRFPENSDGTTVLMRYTLRLLTSQQFARASTLICACDQIRKELNSRKRNKSKAWKKPVSIGLWIGGDHTPNKSRGDKSAEYYCGRLIDRKKGIDIERRNEWFNKFQVLSCPWCGASLIPHKNSKDEKWGYQINSDNHRFYMRCTRPKCPYINELPIQVVDEELYREPPTLLFATVDKFAMMTWNADVGAFFATNSQNRAPELIIQDELHLISGPLGSVVGLYECAIDSLCSAKGVRPKIIASTATIRRASEQCRLLYNRSARQFPPAGLDSDDSFFAKEADVTRKPGRMYVGVFPSGKTKAMLETRAMATLLQRTYMQHSPDEIKDNYWTLVGYFNSLRDLGKCSGLVDDDIKDYMKRLSRRIASDAMVRTISVADELTSRVPTTTLVKRLKALEKLKYSSENKSGPYAINVLLATNMISVGVDVDRLNLMTVIGQPKLTSEYIQATSRVGRSNPGLVFTLYDATKSRDRSHYEQFLAYHDSFYRYVEPTSVTPFSRPALERALHAVVVALTRHAETCLTEEKDAQNFESTMQCVSLVKNDILTRIKEIYEHSKEETHTEILEVENAIDDFFCDWNDLASNIGENRRFVYGQSCMMSGPKENDQPLLMPYGTWTRERAYETLTSMRNVDQTISARMLVWEDEE
ncbi:MAG: helicase-related protein [Christensenellales bacterium]|nr:helicase-related protein [Christensenellales bacterium]